MSALAEVEAGAELEGEGAAEVGEAGTTRRWQRCQPGWSAIGVRVMEALRRGLRARTSGGGSSMSATSWRSHSSKLAEEGGVVVPAADAFALDALEVVGEAADEQEVGELGAELVAAVEGGGLADDRSVGRAVDGEGDEAGVGEGALAAGWQEELEGVGGGGVGELEEGGAVAGADEAEAPALLGEGRGGAHGHEDAGRAPQAVFGVVDALAVVECGGLVVAVVRGAEEEAGEAEGEVAGVGAGAEGVPGGEAGAGLGGREVVDLREQGEVVEAEEGGGCVGEEGHVGEGREGGGAVEQGEVVGVGAEREGGAEEAVGAAAVAGVGDVVNVVVEAGVGELAGAEVVLELVSAQGEEVDADVVVRAERGDEAVEGAPQGLEALEGGVVEQGVEDAREAAVELGDGGVDGGAGWRLGQGGRHRS